ncbi:MAG: GNAT family N-acetyltransferase, partial [Pseudomonadota bacterium]
MRSSKALDKKSGVNRLSDRRISCNGKTYTVSCLKSVTELEAFRSEWERLQALNGEAFSYFQTFDWCMTWARVFAAKAGAELQVYVVWLGDTAIALFPFAVNQPTANVRVLSILGEPLGQYGGIVHDPVSFNPELGKAVLRAIKRESRCDTICVSHCPAHSMLWHVVRDEGLPEEPRNSSAILDLDAIPDWDTYHASLPKSMRKERNKRRNKLSSAGKLDYRVVPAGTKEFGTLLAQCLEFKKVWLSETGRLAGNLGTPETLAFFQSLGAQTRNGQPVSGAVVQSLSVDGEVVGIEFGMICGGDYYSYLGGINWEWRKFSPGKVQMEFAQRWAKENGIRRFDFLSDPSDYKSFWTNSKHELLSVSIPLSAKGYIHSRIWKS